VVTFDFYPRTRLVFANGASSRLGELAREIGFHRTLLVADQGLVATGQVSRASLLLRADGLSVLPFHDFDSNPDSEMVEAGRAYAAPLAVDSIVAWGGGSSLDCAKGINFLLTNGGRMQDYRGYGRAAQPLLPMMAVPTTAGTGSEVQSYALISDAETHEKMACGDPKAAFRIAILDPELTMSQPKAVTAASGYDAIAHAVETAVTRTRNGWSGLFSREAWRLLELNFERVLSAPDDLDARGAMQLGSCYAGLAIECSMLGAAHACANPLTARYGTTHGHALAVLLPHVVRWNAAEAGGEYADLLRVIGAPRSPGADAAERLAARLADLAAVGRLPTGLRSLGVGEDDLPVLAEQAAAQWTGTFNPRAFDAGGALEIYRAAF
jgi:alcohol dehydrogenase